MNSTAALFVLFCTVLLLVFLCTAAVFLQDSLFMLCINSRLYRLSRAQEPPFFSAAMSDESACGAIDMYVLGAMCEEQKTLR
jgi:hypothetical protein